MKKSLILIVACISMIACKKEGYVYKANFMDKDKYYGGGDISGSILTSFFFVDMNDSNYAADWYTKTEAFPEQFATCDSFWVEYVCTAEEWGKNR